MTTLIRRKQDGESWETVPDTGGGSGDFPPSWWTVDDNNETAEFDGDITIIGNAGGDGLTLDGPTDSRRLRIVHTVDQSVTPFTIESTSGNEWFMAHETGGVCIGTVEEPNWGSLHVYPYSNSQAKPLIVSTQALGDPQRVFAFFADGSIDGFIWDNVLPWTIDIDPMMPPATVTGFGSFAGPNSPYGYVRFTSAQNDQIGWDVVLSEGTWTVEVAGNTRTDNGIATVSLDGVSAGTIDGYSASPADPATLTLANIAVTQAGKKRLLLKMATKNGSSSGYQFALYRVRLRRTA